MKKLMGFLLLIITITSMSLSAFASVETDNDDYNDYSWEKDDIEGTPSTERWSYIASTSQGMSINNNSKATLLASITAYPDKVDKVIIYMYLQKYEDGIWKILHGQKMSSIRLEVQWNGINLTAPKELTVLKSVIMLMPAASMKTMLPTVQDITINNK